MALFSVYWFRKPLLYPSELRGHVTAQHTTASEPEDYAARTLHCSLWVVNVTLVAVAFFRSIFVSRSVG